VSRRKGRILAFQALYSWDVSQTPLEDLLKFSWQNAQVPEDSDSDETVFARIIVTGAIEHVAQIDELIKNHLSANWTMERINKVTLAILRMSIYEMEFQKDSQKNIVIDEAVNIAREYGLEDSYKFINAVLDKIGKEN
jgi:N utilization substance protein B